MFNAAASVDLDAAMRRNRGLTEAQIAQINAHLAQQMEAARQQMVARLRALELAGGPPHVEIPVGRVVNTWEGVEKGGPNGDPRPPLLWVGGGLALAVVCP